MNNFKVVKRADPSIWVQTGKNTKVGRSWYGQCPVCQEYIKGDNGSYHWYSNTKNTRKTAKDAVYRHMRVKHR